MSFLGLLLLFVLFYFLVLPLIRTWITVSKIKKGDFSVFGDLFGHPGAQQKNSTRNPDGSRKAGWTRPIKKKKKISTDTGEYVKFTEIKTETSETIKTDNQTISYTDEQQITDVEWEDVK